MSRRVVRTQRFVVIGFLGGLAVAASCAAVEEVLISARNVSYEDTGATKLQASHVQAAIEKLKAMASAPVSWKDIKGVPADIADGDDRGQFKAGSAIEITGGTIGVKLGKAKGSAAEGDHAHSVVAKDISDFDTAAKAAMGPEGNANAYRHQRFGENDLKASVAFAALEKKVTSLQNQNLLSQIQLLQDKVNKRAKCPGGFVHKPKSGMMLCTRTNDEMVRVGDFWVDRYEALLVDEDFWNGGKCDNQFNKGAKYGDVDAPKYPTDWPRSGDWTNTTKRLYACSVYNKQPSRDLSWFQALQACAAAGKHLCTMVEWQTAVAGTSNSTCNTSSGKVNNTGMSSCASSWGAEDMVGNLSEFVGTLLPAGVGGIKTDGEKHHPFPYNSSNDVTVNVNSRVELAPFNWKNGMLAAPRQGGDRDDKLSAGKFGVDLSKSPVYHSNSTGFRCCVMTR